MTADHTLGLDAVLADHDHRLSALQQAHGALAAEVADIRALLATVQPPAPEPEPETPVVETPGPYVPPTWVEFLRYDFADAELGRFTQSRQYGFVAFQSGKLVNDGLAPTDTSNDKLQKPTRFDAVEVVADPLASHGKALALWSREGEYETSAGVKRGFVNGRIQTEQNWALPMAVSMRARRAAPGGMDDVFTYDKSTGMWWPTGGGWPWEVDFDEHFANGRPGTSMRHHVDQNGDGKATEQIIEDLPLINIGEYHWYTFVAYENRNEYYVDDQLVLEVTDPAWVLGKRAGHPKSGVFAYGRALKGPRSTHTKPTSSVIDEVLVHKPAA